MHYKYIIAGAGMASAAAINAIRKIDNDCTIGVIGDENFVPYKRPYLSKDLWKGKPLDSAWIKIDHKAVDFMLGRKVKELRPESKTIIDDQGNIFTFDKLLIATGGTPKELPFGGDNIIYYRNMADYQLLSTITERFENFVVIGGGFIGSEIAAALALNGKTVTMIFPEDNICSRMFPADLSNFLTNYYRKKNVKVLNNDTPIDVKDNKVFTKKGLEIPVDGIIAGIGINLNTDFAEAAGLKIDNGIVVDEYCCTSHPDIYAAGDVANFHNPELDKRIRVEHEDNANTMGAFAGRAMAGKPELYTHLPYFYSDLFDLGYEAVGETDSQMDIYEDWTEEFKKGVIYYLKAGKVRGVILWNIWEKIDCARFVISSSETYTPSALKGMIKP